MSDSSSTSATQASTRGLLPDLANYVEATAKQFKACIADVAHTFELDEQRATVHLQYVKFDPTNGEPKFSVLASVLAKHVVRYTLAHSTRERMKLQMEDFDEGDLFIKARDYFRKIEDAGEVGELLLFFLLEAAFLAPQVVCKMGLKTNPKDEVKGSDGIHVCWDETDNHLDVYLGESKLYGDVGDALTSVFTSITEFHDLNRSDEELHLVTAHFKHLDTTLQDAITGFLNKESPEGTCHIVHACLVGFDWDKYQLLLGPERDSFFRDFEVHYKKYAKSIEGMLNRRFAGCKHKDLSFKFLFLPFTDVMEFRRAFYRALLGTDVPRVDRTRKPPVASEPAKP